MHIVSCPVSIYSIHTGDSVKTDNHYRDPKSAMLNNYSSKACLSCRGRKYSKPERKCSCRCTVTRWKNGWDAGGVSFYVSSAARRWKTACCVACTQNTRVNRRRRLEWLLAPLVANHQVLTFHSCESIGLERPAGAGLRRPLLWSRPTAPHRAQLTCY